MSAAGTMASMIGRLHHLILDCSDPLALATFYSELLGQAQVRRGPAMDARLARLENRLRVSRDVAEIAARHLAPPSRPE